MGHSKYLKTTMLQAGLLEARRFDEEQVHGEAGHLGWQMNDRPLTRRTLRSTETG